MPDTLPSSRQRAAPNRRLPSALAGLLGLVLVTTVFAWAFLGLSLRSLESVMHDRVEALALLHTVNDEMQHVVVDLAVRAEHHNVAPDSAALLVMAARERAADAWAAYRLTWFTEAESEMVARIAPTIEGGFASAARLGAGLAGGEAQDIASLMDEPFFAELDAFSASLRELVSLQVSVTREAYDVSAARYSIAGQAFLGAVVAACALVLVALLAGPKRVGIPIRRWLR